MFFLLDWLIHCFLRKLWPSSTYMEVLPIMLLNIEITLSFYCCLIFQSLFEVNKESQTKFSQNWTLYDFQWTFTIKLVISFIKSKIIVNSPLIQCNWCKQGGWNFGCKYHPNIMFKVQGSFLFVMVIFMSLSLITEDLITLFLRIDNVKFLNWKVIFNNKNVW